jgi:hypothetical protein
MDHCTAPLASICAVPGTLPDFGWWIPRRNDTSAETRAVMPVAKEVQNPDENVRFRIAIEGSRHAESVR